MTDRSTTPGNHRSVDVAERAVTRGSMPEWVPEWLANEHYRLCDIAEDHGALRWEEMDPEDREMVTLALRNLWDEVIRRG